MAKKIVELIEEEKSAGRTALEDEMAQAAAGELEAFEDRVASGEAAYEKYGRVNIHAENSVVAGQSGEDGVMTEPNYISAEAQRNVLSAIETARLRDPDFADAITRGPVAVDALVEQIESGQSIGAAHPEPLTEEEVEQVDLYRGRGEPRTVDTPKNAINVFEEAGSGDEVPVVDSGDGAEEEIDSGSGGESEALALSTRRRYSRKPKAEPKAKTKGKGKGKGKGKSGGGR